jgi:hypothetical protein
MAFPRLATSQDALVGLCGRLLNISEPLHSRLRCEARLRHPRAMLMYTPRCSDYLGRRDQTLRRGCPPSDAQRERPVASVIYTDSTHSLFRRYSVFSERQLRLVSGLSNSHPILAQHAPLNHGSGLLLGRSFLHVGASPPANR